MPTTDLPPLAAESPTRVRYGVLAFLCALMVVLYVDRVVMGKAATSIQADLHLSLTLMGFVQGAFTIAYGLFEVPTGRWGDRFGSRGVLTRIVLWWSAFTALTGCVFAFSFDSGLRLPLPWTDSVLPLVFDSFVLLLLIRFLFGAGEAGAVPNAARVVARWFPAGNRGPAQGLINTAQLLGGATSPIVAAYAIDWFGWRWTFGLFGLLGVFWAAAFYWWFRDDPAEHPAVNDAERRLIAAGTSEPTKDGTHPPIPWGRTLTSANVWLLGGILSCTAFTSYMVFFWYPTYLEKGRGIESITSGWLAGLVLLGGACGSAFGGWLADWLVRRTGSRRWSRRLVGCGSMSLAAVGLLASVQCDSALVSSICMSLACFSLTSMIASWWACVTAISGRHLGALFGLMNSMGVPGGFGSQVFFGSYADQRRAQGFTGRDQWDPGFTVYACVLLVGALAWLFVDATKPVEPEEPGP